MIRRLGKLASGLRSATAADPAISATIATALLLASARALYETRTCYFFSDDFLNFIQIKDIGVGWAYFVRDFTGEFVPLVRLANLIYFELFRLSFWPYRLLLVAYEWTLVLLLVRLARARSIDTALLLPLLALIVCAPVYSSPYQWWSAALNSLFGGVASLAALCLSADRAPLTQRGRWLGVLLFVAGLLFYPKGLFVAALIYAVRVFIAVNDLRMGLRAASVRGLLDVAPMLAAGCAYVAIVILGGYDPGVPHPDLPTVARYVWTAWNGGFLADILGIDRTATSAVAAANLLVVLLLLVSLLRNRATAILWAGGAVYFIVSMAVVAENRAVPFGINSATSPRYFADMLGYAAALAVIACGATARRAAGSARTWPRAATLGLAVAVSAGGAIHLLRASARVPYVWYAAPKRIEAFVQNVHDALKRAGNNALIEDAAVPPYVMPQWIWPLTKYSYFLTLFPWHEQLVPAPYARWKFDQMGHLRRTAVR